MTSKTKKREKKLIYLVNNYLIISSCSKKTDEFELKACIGLQKSKFQTASSAEIQF